MNLKYRVSLLSIRVLATGCDLLKKKNCDATCALVSRGQTRGEVCEAPPAGRGCSAARGPAAARGRGGRGRPRRSYGRGSRGVLSWRWHRRPAGWGGGQQFVTGPHTPGKLREGELGGRSHIYHHVTARHNTWARVRELYLPRAPRGRPGTRAAAGEGARQSPGGARATPTPRPPGRRGPHGAGG